MIRNSALTIVLVLACLAAPASALAGNGQGHNKKGGGNTGTGGTTGQTGTRSWVPEFDPATVGAVAVVLAGGGLILARRRKP